MKPLSSPEAKASGLLGFGIRRARHQTRSPRISYHPFMSTDPYRRRPLRRFLRNWLERHQHPCNFAIHLLGIPLAFAGVAMFFVTHWYWALAAFVGGYALQWLGHLVEGNDMGEWAGIKRLLGLPYVAIAPPRRKDE